MEKNDKKVSLNPEVTEKAARRRFTREYKERIATEAEQCQRPGELGALLRREGLHSSTHSTLTGLTPALATLSSSSWIRTGSEASF